MLKKIVIAIVMTGFIASCGSGGKTLVTVNGKKITEGDLDFLSNINPRLKMQLASPFGKKQILDNLVDQELLYQEALKKGLQRDPIVKAKIDLYKKVVIAQSMIENEMKSAAKEYYNNNKSDFEKLQMSDILIKFAQPPEKNAKGKTPPLKDKITRTKEAALKLAGDIKARLDKGEDFAALAKEFSDDAITKNSGGDLGGVSKADPRLERRGYGPLLEKAFTMKVGETAGPIETSDGYHIIIVTKGVELEPFETAEQSILFKIQGEQRNKMMTELKENAKIVYSGEEKPKAEVKPEAAPAEQPKEGATGPAEGAVTPPSHPHAAPAVKTPAPAPKP